MLPPEGRVLIVDDEPYIRTTLSRLLSREGYDFVTAADGLEAWQTAQQGEFDLLVSDITMPKMSGLELLGLVRARFPDLAVIMVTAVDSRETAVRALELGAYGYVMKPFDQDEILISAASALERRRLAVAEHRHRERLARVVRERTSELRAREEEIALRLVWAAERRDQETGAHIRRIGLYSAALAQKLGWGTHMTDDIRVAATMHDIGKIGIPDEILRKPGKYTDQEYEVMKKHSEIGAEILSGSDVPLLQMAWEIAYCHHEKWDGSGYPRGLAGEQIPESARIVTIADVYDALINERVYRRALPEEEALEIMNDNRVKGFAPPHL